MTTEIQPAKSRKSPRGSARTDLVQAAVVGDSSDIFPTILQLYARQDSRIADVTYGTGVFWRRIPDDQYKTRYLSDIQTGTDARHLPYSSGSLELLVFDPPYLRPSGDSTYQTSEHQAFRSYYKVGEGAPPEETPEGKWHEALLSFYFEGFKEHARVLCDNGVYVVKCQDEVCANRQRLTHVELIRHYEAAGFVVEDLFMLVRAAKAGVSRCVRQLHARKNLSFFIVARKDSKGRIWEGP